MPEQNKLKIYQFIIGKRFSSEEISNEVLYEKFNSGSLNSDEHIFPRVAGALYESFNGEFKKDKKGSRAISITNDGLISFNSSRKIIHGFVNGGITDAAFKQFAIDNSHDAESLIGRNKVLGQDYYFLIYIPKETNLGFILLQYNDSVVRGISSALFEHLANFLKSYDLKIDFKPYCPKSIIDDFLSGSAVIEIEFIQHKTIDELSPLRGEISTYTLSRKLTKINIPFGQLTSFLFTGNNIKQEILSLIGMADQEDLKISVNYKKGKSTRKAKIDKKNIIPEIDIEDRFIDDEKTDESINKMFGFASNYLTLLEREIQFPNNNATT